MAERYYVTTDETGVEHAAEGPVIWALPGESGPSVTEAGGAALVLRRPATLIDDLEARIFVAEAVGDAREHDGRLEVRAARLVAATRWDAAAAARLALECASHVLGDAADVELPHGRTLGQVLADAREALERSSPEAESRLGFLARVRAAHRLRREGATVQEIALELLTEDNAAEIAAIDDPAWTRVAAVVDAVLAAVEALRSFSLPRYVRVREDPVEETGEDAPSIPSSPTVTPWGTVVLGAEHQSPYVPAWVGARDAAARARDVARESGGEEGAAAERAYQGALLEALL